MDQADELFIVVDRTDKIIGYRTRFDCHHNKQLIHRGIGVVVLNNQGQILLQKRANNKDIYPGLYTISTSGHVNKGETYKQAAQRELLEELGIQAPIKREKKYILETEQETEMDYLFTSKHDGPFYPNKDEVNELKFVNTGQVKGYTSVLTPFAILSLKQLGIL